MVGGACTPPIFYTRRNMPRRNPKELKEYERSPHRNRLNRVSRSERWRILRLTPEGTLALQKEFLDNKRWSLYRLRPEDYESLLARQGRCCAICKEPFIGYPCVDHDHSCCNGHTSCGKCVRGLLCIRCNTGIGNLRDRMDLLESSIKYLRGEAPDDNRPATRLV